MPAGTSFATARRSRTRRTRTAIRRPCCRRRDLTYGPVSLRSPERRGRRPEPRRAIVGNRHGHLACEAACADARRPASPSSRAPSSHQPARRARPPIRWVAQPQPPARSKPASAIQTSVPAKLASASSEESQTHDPSRPAWVVRLKRRLRAPITWPVPSVQRLRPALGEALLVVFAATALAAAAFGRPVLGHLGSRVLGDGRDPQVFVWAMGWWPHAIAHGLDPVVTHALWAARGFDLLWTSSVPGLSLLAAPVTLVWGPVAAYNVMAIAAPGLAAGALHLLGRGLGARRAPAAAAGLLFAICPYEAATTTSHLHISFVAPAVLAAALVVWAPAARPGWIAAVGAAAVLQFLVAPEVFATSVAAGATVLVLVARLRPEARPAVAVAARTMAGGVALALLICSPVAVDMALHGPGRLYPPGAYTTDALNLVLPTVLTAIRPPFAGDVAAHFPGNLPEQGGYLGLVVLALVAGLATRRATRRAFAVPLAFLAVALVASFGPRLQIDGSPGGPLPMAVAGHLPLVDNVLPSRLALYVWLAVCVVFALWLSRGRSPAR